MALAACLSALAVRAGEADPPAAAAPVLDAPSSSDLTLAMGSELRMRLSQDIGSKLSKTGDTFVMELIEDAVVDGHVVLPVGTRVEGEIIHAAKAGLGGRAGELIATARRVRAGDREIALRSLVAGSGENRTDVALGVSIVVGFPGLFVKGGEIVLPAGTEFTSRTVDAVSFPRPPAGDDVRLEARPSQE